MKLKDLIDTYPTRLDDPDRVVLKLRMDEAIVIWAPTPFTREQIEATLETDASYLPKTGVEGTAWRFIRRGKEYKIQTRSRRYGKGPNVAEMRAIIQGMKDAQKRDIQTLLIKTDSGWSANMLAGLWTAKQSHTIPVVEEALSLLERFEGVALVHTRTRNLAQVDRAARRAAERKRDEVKEKLAKRLEAVQGAMDRAGEVHLDRAGDGWIANNRFAVHVNPPSCTCPGWKLRWKSVPLPGKRARRNPCKHLAAGAMAEGVRHPEDLLALARKAKK